MGGGAKRFNIAGQLACGVPPMPRTAPFEETVPLHAQQRRYRQPVLTHQDLALKYRTLCPQRPQRAARFTRNRRSHQRRGIR